MFMDVTNGNDLVKKKRWDEYRIGKLLRTCVILCEKSLN